MAEASLAQNSTICLSVQPNPTTDALGPPPPTVRLKLRKPQSKKKVAWTTDTVDNEHMNKKKSKCCCVYEKPRQFDESSSDTDDECEHCRGHVEVKKDKHDGGKIPLSSMPHHGKGAS